MQVLMFAVLLLLWSTNVEIRPNATCLCGLLTLATSPFRVLQVPALAPVLHSFASQVFQWLEFFAGQAQNTRFAAASGLRTAKFDVTYDQPAMDLLTPAGMSLL